jgi:hypothetical protein
LLSPAEESGSIFLCLRLKDHFHLDRHPGWKALHAKTRRDDIWFSPSPVCKELAIHKALKESSLFFEVAPHAGQNDELYAEHSLS